MAVGPEAVALTVAARVAAAGRLARGVAVSEVVAMATAARAVAEVAEVARVAAKPAEPAS